MSTEKEGRKEGNRPGPRGDPTRGGSPKNASDWTIPATRLVITNFTFYPLGKEDLLKYAHGTQVLRRSPQNKTPSKFKSSGSKLLINYLQ